jgi:hypothetical protein
MIKRLFALCAVLGLAMSAHAAQPDASYGEHGMALFGGKDGLYASHLPMFHAPHDYQVIIQVHLADRAQDAALRARIDDKVTLWTVAPEKFELDRLDPKTSHRLERFKADIVLGHFEQGGKTQYANATVVVDRVLVFRQLAPQARTSSDAHYLPVGRFLVKQIDSRPDYDHIVAMSSMMKAPVDVQKHGLAEPAAADLARAAGAAVRATVYYFTEDLQ